jgi:hypothetical protein
MPPRRSPWRTHRAGFASFACGRHGHDAVSASADHVDVAAPTARTAPAQPHQRDIATAGSDEGREVGIGLMATVPADQQDPEEARCGEGRSSMKPGEWQAEVLAMGTEGDLH